MNAPAAAVEVSSVDDNAQDLTNQEDGDSYLPSNWDYYDGDGEYGDVNWNERTDPCKPAYYRWGQNIRDQRNLLASNIGLIAKRAAKGKLLAVVTALDTAKPLSGVKVDAVNFQNQSSPRANRWRRHGRAGREGASPSR